MQTLQLSDVVDREMRVPQPAKWVTHAVEMAEALVHAKYDEVVIDAPKFAEAATVLLRKHPAICPKRVVVTRRIDPVLTAKIGVWLGDITQVVQA